MKVEASELIHDCYALVDQFLQVKEDCCHWPLCEDCEYRCAQQVEAVMTKYFTRFGVTVVEDCKQSCK